MSARVLVAVHAEETMTCVRDLLSRSPGFTICAEETSAVGAVARAVELAPDVCLLGVDIPGGGIPAAWEISARLPTTKIVLLTDRDLGRGLVTALASGLSGYVRIDRELGRLPRVLEAVLGGEIAIPRSAAAPIAAELREGRARRRSIVANDHSARLTSREWEVLELLCAGQETPRIARRLGVRQATVRSHIAGAVRKLNVPDREAAVRLLSGR